MGVLRDLPGVGGELNNAVVWFSVEENGYGEDRATERKIACIVKCRSWGDRCRPDVSSQAHLWRFVHLDIPSFLELQNQYCELKHALRMKAIIDN